MIGAGFGRDKSGPYATPHSPNSLRRVYWGASGHWFGVWRRGLIYHAQTITPKPYHPTHPHPCYTYSRAHVVRDTLPLDEQLVYSRFDLVVLV